MKELSPRAFKLLKDRNVFEEISSLKLFFVSVFSQLGNDFPTNDILQVHPGSKGLKISKGNELLSCPYQVLDIVRDFDMDNGFNIRILNWWGRGLFIFVFFGYENRFLIEDSLFLSWLQHHEYLLAKSDSPWDYEQIIDKNQVEPIHGVDQLTAHLRHSPFTQFVKRMDYPDDRQTLQSLLKDQIWEILKFYKR